MSSECIELNNIKYKTMLMNGTLEKETNNKIDMSDIEMFLEKEKTQNENVSWNKLEKNIKVKKLMLFAENYIEENKLNNDDLNTLKKFLKTSIDKKEIIESKRSYL